MNYIAVIKFDILSAVGRYDKQIPATGDLRRLKQTFDFSSTCILFIHIPCHLNQSVDFDSSLNYEITFPSALIIKYLVDRSTLTVKLKEHRIFQLFPSSPLWGNNTASRKPLSIQ